ncbi:MAG: hypothetical protein P8Z68_04855 [Kineosporiaceae bacterium]|jgi:hypothetical protein
MPTDLRSWVFGNPRRLLLIVGGLIVAVVVVSSIISARGNGDDASGALSRNPAAGAQVPDAEPFVNAAVAFVAAWGKLAHGQSAEEWHAAVRELATPDLGSYLDTVDPSSLPDATPSGKPTIVGLTATSAIVTVPLSNGQSVSVSVLVSGADTWLVDDIQPATGN